MLVVHPILDDPGAIGEAVQALAAAVHRLSVRISFGRSAHHEEVLAAMRRRAEDLLSQVACGGPEGLQWRLRNLQKRVIALQWLSDDRETPPETGRPRPAA